MRVLTSIQEGGGVAAGVYPTPIIEKYVSAKGFATWRDASQTEGVLIPDNYNDASSQTNIDNTYSDVNDAFPLTTGLIGDGQTLKYLAESFVQYERSKIFRISPYNEFISDLGGSTPIVSANTVKFCRIDTNKFIFAWLGISGTNTRIFIRVADRTSGVTVFGNVQEVTGKNFSSSSYDNWDIQYLTTDKFIVFFNDVDNSNRLSAFAVTLDVSDVINAIGTTLEISTSANQNIQCSEHAAPNKVLMSWANAANLISISASGTTLSAGTPVDATGGGAVGSLASFRYISDNSLVLVVASPSGTDWFCRMVTLSGNTITLQAEDSRSSGSSGSKSVLAMGTTSATRAHFRWQLSSLHRLWSIDISGNLATFNGVDDITVVSGDDLYTNRNDGFLYVINTDSVIDKYDTDHNLIDSYSNFELINWPTTPSSSGRHNSIFRDLRNGISFYISYFSSDDKLSAHTVSPETDVDVVFNGQTVHSSGTPTFGLVANVDTEINYPFIEISITNQSGGFSGFTPDQLIATVN